MKKVAIIISPNWRDYAERYLAECLASVAVQDYQGEMKVYLIDNESTESSRAFINENCRQNLGNLPWMLLTHDDNAGFARGNNTAMTQAMLDGCDAVALFNMDGVLDKSCVSRMVDALYSADNNGSAQARLMLHSDKTRINSLGNSTHFLGFGYSDAYQELYQESMISSSDDHEICYPSGAAVIFRSLALEQVGLFDDEFWMYNEDQDLGWRLWLAGWRSVLARDAVFFHKYSFAKSIKQFYWQDRNRLITALKNYRLRTIILVIPAFIISEIGIWLASLRGSWFRERVRVYRYFCSPETWRYLAQARRRSQEHRKVTDRQIVKLFSGKILYQEISSLLVKAGNLVLNLYWQIAKRIIVW